MYKNTCVGPEEKLHYKPEACTICNLERNAIAVCTRERSLNKRADFAVLCPHFRSCHFKIHLITFFYLSKVYNFKIAILV